MRNPFSAIVGHNNVRHALLLLDVDPGLKGVLIGGASGLAKSLLARSFRSILPKSRPFIEVPLGATEDRLLGGLDLARTINVGTRQFSTGLLAHAHRGVLHVDDINLLDVSLTGHIAAALDSGAVRVEREGISVTFPADFILVGTYNPAEGEVPVALKDRVGLLASVEPLSEPDRAEAVARVCESEFERGGAERFVRQDEATVGLIERAKARLNSTAISRDQAQLLIAAALRLGVEGNRADIFAVRAARASAALAGRGSVEEKDIIIALELVLVPRATVLPSPPQAEDSQRQDTADSSELPQQQAPIDDLLLRAVEARIPADLITGPRQHAGRSKPGRRIDGSSRQVGRYVWSHSHRTRDGRVAVDATLRAAAPFQQSRRARASSSPADRRIRVTPDDLRYKRLKRRSGVLFILAVDASGSMAANRMGHAKGAAARLLQDAYLRRDKVALVCFRGHEAKVLLAPTRSVELAKRLVDALPAGGGTPLASALVRALEIARLERLQGMRHAVLAVFTDGRANVSLGSGQVREELKRIGALLQLEGITSVVVDTRSRFAGGGDGQSLADWLGGRYFYLPRGGVEDVYDAVASVTGRVRPRRPNGASKQT
jgi:magnesium chelatase subunit D